MRSLLSQCKALADSNRLRVLAVLLRDGERELCACEVAELLTVAGATVSRHMQILTAADLVTARKAGRWVYYRISPDLSPLLSAWINDALKNSETLAEDLQRVSTPFQCSPSTPERKSVQPQKKDRHDS